MSKYYDKEQLPKEPIHIIIEDTPISKLYINNELQYDLTPKEDKKIEKFLDKKVSMVSAIWLVIFLYIITVMFTLIKNDYYYIDTNNNSGHSNKCYYNGNTRQIECLAPIKVQQYYKN